MATAADHPTPEHEQRESEHAASFHAAQSRANDAEFMSSLKERLDIVDGTDRRTTMTRDEFVAHTDA